MSCREDTAYSKTDIFTHITQVYIVVHTLLKAATLKPLWMKGEPGGVPHQLNKHMTTEKSRVHSQEETSPLICLSEQRATCQQRRFNWSFKLL